MSISGITFLKQPGAATRPEVSRIWTPWCIFFKSWWPPFSLVLAALRKGSVPPDARSVGCASSTHLGGPRSHT